MSTTGDDDKKQAMIRTKLVELCGLVTGLPLNELQGRLQGLQQVPALVQGDVEAGVQSSEKIIDKRPPEPAVHLNLNRNEELNAMVKQGRVEAEAAQLGAGFLGGDSKFIVGVFIICGLVTLVMGFSAFVSMASGGEGECGTAVCLLADLRVFSTGLYLGLYPSQ